LRKRRDKIPAGTVERGERCLLNGEGKHDEALSMARNAADTEDRTEKSPVTPGAVLPARELFGAMLLERGMANEALATFEATLAKEPNRYNAFAGAARAAERLGEKAKAKSYYEKVIALTSGADAQRPELAAARRFLAGN
jgi:tetratricopeptide (TPR) repeat protein